MRAYCFRLCDTVALEKKKCIELPRWGPLPFPLRTSLSSVNILFCYHKMRRRDVEPLRTLAAEQATPCVCSGHHNSAGTGDIEVVPYSIHRDLPSTGTPLTF